MKRGRPATIGSPQVSIRVLLSEADYEFLRELAATERTDVGALVRRALAYHFFIPGNSNTIKQEEQQN